MDFSCERGNPKVFHFCYVVVLLHILFSASNFFEIKIATWTQSFGSWEFDQSVWLMCDQKFCLFVTSLSLGVTSLIFLLWKGKPPMCSLFMTHPQCNFCSCCFMFVFCLFVCLLLLLLLLLLLFCSILCCCWVFVVVVIGWGWGWERYVKLTNWGDFIWYDVTNIHMHF